MIKMHRSVYKSRHLVSNSPHLLNILVCYVNIFDHRVHKMDSYAAKTEKLEQLLGHF